MKFDDWKELEIVFTKSKKLLPIFSWLVMLWTRKSYSHVARAIEIQNWGKRYFQASEGRVNYEYQDFFLKKHEIVKTYKLKIPKELDRKIKHECYKQAGNKYATMQNLGIILVDIAAWFTIKIKNPFKSGKNCSELIYTEVLKELYPDLNFNKDTIKPHHIERILLAKGHKPC